MVAEIVSHSSFIGNRECDFTKSYMVPSFFSNSLGLCRDLQLHGYTNMYTQRSKSIQNSNTVDRSKINRWYRSGLEFLQDRASEGRLICSPFLCVCVCVGGVVMCENNSWRTCNRSRYNSLSNYVHRDIDC